MQVATYHFPHSFSVKETYAYIDLSKQSYCSRFTYTEQLIRDDLLKAILSIYKRNYYTPQVMFDTIYQLCKRVFYRL